MIEHPVQSVKSAPRVDEYIWVNEDTVIAEQRLSLLKKTKLII